VVDGKQVMPCMMNTGVQESTVGKVVVLYSPMHCVGLVLYEVERKVACEAVCCSLSCRLCVAAVVFSVLDLYMLRCIGASMKLRQLLRYSSSSTRKSRHGRIHCVGVSEFHCLYPTFITSRPYPSRHRDMNLAGLDQATDIGLGLGPPAQLLTPISVRPLCPVPFS
jgi:hypothetical protein